MLARNYGLAVVSIISIVCHHSDCYFFVFYVCDCPAAVPACRKEKRSVLRDTGSRTTTLWRPKTASSQTPRNIIVKKYKIEVIIIFSVVTVQRQEWWAPAGPTGWVECSETVCGDPITTGKNYIRLTMTFYFVSFAVYRSPWNNGTAKPNEYLLPGNPCRLLL